MIYGRTNGFALNIFPTRLILFLPGKFFVSLDDEYAVITTIIWKKEKHLKINF